MQNALRWVLEEYKQVPGDVPTVVSWNSLLFFLQKLDNIRSKHGLEYMVKTVKAVRNHVTRYLCGDPLLISTMRIGLTKSGLPKILGPLVPIIQRKEPSDIRHILTLLNVSRQFKGTGELDASSIVNPTTGGMDSINDYAFKSKIMFNRLCDVGWISKPHKDNQSYFTDYHLSTKSGPNGQAMASSMDELNQMPDWLLNDIKTFGGPKITENINLILPVLKDLNFEADCIFRRISVLQDKEMKNRPIAIFDYWSQTVLKPFHDTLLGILKSISTDLTFNQDGCKDISKAMKGNNKFHSLDLSSATDRFPVRIEESIVETLLGSERSQSWLRIMTKEGFYYKDYPDKIYYRTGQPMGGYSSWAIFALCHHIIVQIANYEVSNNKDWKPFNNYRILGDDIVIWDDSVARQYLKILSSLGVEVSPTKSHVSKDTYEMAKRWFHKGVEVTPFPLNSLIEEHNNPYGLGYVLQDSIRKSWETISNQSCPGKLLKLRFLLSSFGYNNRSIERAIPRVKDAFNFYQTLNDPDSYRGARSIQEIVRRHGSNQSIPSPKSILNELTLVIRLIKTKGLESLLDNLDTIPLDCEVVQDIVKEKLSDCSLPIPPDLDSLIPTTAVLLKVREQCSEALWTVGSYALCTSLKEMVNLGSTLVVPNPEHIISERKSKLILNRSNKLLNELVTILHNRDSSSSFIDDLPRLEEYVENMKSINEDY